MKANLKAKENLEDPEDAKKKVIPFHGALDAHGRILRFSELQKTQMNEESNLYIEPTNDQDKFVQIKILPDPNMWQYQN